MDNALMTKAREIHDKHEGFYSFDEAIKLAEAVLKGYTHSFCISTSAGRVFGFAASWDDVNRARINRKQELVVLKRAGGPAVYGDNMGRL
jgi:hypothetical protein